ncbi:MAG: VOC family protein [Balneolaceae bacterium]
MSTNETLLTTQLDHLALHINDLEKSAIFYGEIVGLAELPCPLVKRKIRWFSLGNGLSLHLIQEGDEPILPRKEMHIALQTDDFDGFLNRLDEHGVIYTDWPGTPGAVHIREDGLRQIFFKDPDGYWLEINDLGEESQRG